MTVTLMIILSVCWWKRWSKWLFCESLRQVQGYSGISGISGNSDRKLQSASSTPFCKDTHDDRLALLMSWFRHLQDSGPSVDYPVARRSWLGFRKILYFIHWETQAFTLDPRSFSLNLKHELVPSKLDPRPSNIHMNPWVLNTPLVWSGWQ